MKQPEILVSPQAAPPEGGHSAAASASFSTRPSGGHEKPIQKDQTFQVRLRHQEQALTPTLQGIHNYRYWGINE